MNGLDEAGGGSAHQRVLDLIACGAFERARDLAARSVVAAPKDPVLRGLLARAHVHLGAIDVAEAILREVVAECPDDLPTRVSLALVLLRRGAAEEAEGQLRHVVTVCPEHERAWGYLGVALELLGRVAEAQHALMAGNHHRALKGMVARHTLPAAQAMSSASATLVPRVPAVALPDMPMFSETLRPAPISEIEADNELPAAALLEQSVDPPTILDVALSALIVLSDEPRVRSHPSGLLTVALRSTPEIDVTFCARESSLKATVGVLRYQHFIHAQTTFTNVAGAGHLVLAPSDGARLMPLQIDEDTAYVRADHLAGYESKLLFDTALVRLGKGRTLPLVQFRGNGVVVLELERPLIALDVRLSQVVVAEGALLGWLGQLKPEQEGADSAGAGHAIVLRGEGTVLLFGPRVAVSPQTT